MAAEAAVMVVGATLAAAAEVIGAGSTVCGLGVLIRMAISAQIGPVRTLGGRRVPIAQPHVRQNW